MEKPMGGIAVGFRDGAVMSLRDKEAFKKMLEKGR
jgi:hypothetical protein